MKTKSIKISEVTKNRLAKYGNMLSDWDRVINDILDHVEKCDKWYEDRL